MDEKLGFPVGPLYEISSVRTTVCYRYFFRLATEQINYPYTSVKHNLEWEEM